MFASSPPPPAAERCVTMSPFGSRWNKHRISVVSYPSAADYLAQQYFALELEVHRPAEPEEIAQGEWPPVQKKVPVRELISLSSPARVWEFCMVCGIPTEVPHDVTLRYRSYIIGLTRTHFSPLSYAARRGHHVLLYSLVVAASRNRIIAVFTYTYVYHEVYRVCDSLGDVSAWLRLQQRSDTSLSLLTLTLTQRIISLDQRSVRTMTPASPALHCRVLPST